MEKLLNNRILLVFVLNKLKNLQEESSPIYQACKTACIVLSSQIVALRIKENLIGAELEGSELLLNETLTNKESLDYIQKFFNIINKEKLVLYEQSEPSFSNMSNIMLTGSIRIVLDYLEENK